MQPRTHAAAAHTQHTAGKATPARGGQSDGGGRGAGQEGMHSHWLCGGWLRGHALALWRWRALHVGPRVPLSSNWPVAFLCSTR